MTRVTENMMYGAIERNMTVAKDRLLSAQTQASSGVSLQKASDDPANATRVAALDSAQTRLTAMGSAATDTSIRLGATDTALNDMSGIVDRAREIAVEAANGTLTSDERIDLEKEVEQLRERMLAAANTRSNGDYVFGGYRTDQQPFAADGTYQGDNGVQQIEVSPGTHVDGNLPGSQVLNPSGGTDVLGVLKSLSADLTSNDQAGISSRLDELDRAITQISTARATVGVGLKTVTDAENHRADLADKFTAARSKLAEVDVADSYTKLVQAQQAYESTITIASSLMQSFSLASKV